MKYSLLFSLLCLVVGFDLANPDEAGDPDATHATNSKNLPGYMGDIVINGERFESYLVPEFLDTANIDLMTAPKRVWTSDVLETEAGEIRISFRYTTGSGEIIDSQIDCNKITFEEDGTEQRCVDSLAKGSYTLHLVPRVSI